MIVVKPVTLNLACNNNILNTKATNSLGLRDKIKELKKQFTLVKHRYRVVKKETNKLRDQKSLLKETINNYNNKIKKQEAL